MFHQYVTNSEFANSPTGLNLTNLIPAGYTADEQQAVTRLLQRASEVVDRECQQSLYAETRTDIFRVWPDVDGNLVIRARKFPVTQVVSMQVRTSPQAGYVDVNPDSIQIDPGLYPQLVRSYGCYGYYRARGPVTVQMTYVAGFVNTTITQASQNGDMTLTVADATGITAGMVLPIEDGANSENAIVQSVSGNVVQLASACTMHQKGTGVSLVPQIAKLATVMVATFLLNERSSGEVEIGYGTTRPTMGKVKNVDEYQLALTMLQPLKRVI
jgi:hypothetical protein